MERYIVEIKAYKTGEWYVKTRTNNIASAYSVALVHSKGREYRIIDTETDIIIKEGY